MPQRIQLRRTKGWRKPAGAIVVSRPSKWGNPFVVGTLIDRIAFSPVRDPGNYTITESRVRDINHSVQVYRSWLGGTPTLVDAVPPTADEIAALRGHDLGCWCPLDSPCHADVLLELANEKEQS